MNLSKILCWSLIAVCAGCQGVNVPSFRLPEWKMKSPFSKLRAQNSDEGSTEYTFGDESETRVETPLIGEYTRVTGLNMITLQGVGLVTGLNGTGGDPPPSELRRQLADAMKRNNVKNISAILRDPNTALVIVRAYEPPMVKKKDRFDVEVRLPDGSEATSLQGGWLMPTLLTEQAYVPGRVITGKIRAKAQGPILSLGEPDDGKNGIGTQLRGSVLGGATSLSERDLMIFLRNDYRSYRTSKNVARQIGNRFHLYTHGIREPAAEAKTDQKITLKVLPRYKDNFPRYLQVIRNIPRRETAVARRVRTEILKDQLNHPPTSERAALQLEAIGIDAIPVLKTGLKHQSLEVRFHAAMALAYLGEANGVNALVQAARQETAFRAYAFAGLASLDSVDVVIALRNLMGEKSSETRYGAFRSLSTMDENDPFLNMEKIDDYFALHVLNTSGPPLVHLTNRKKGELVLFGAEQKFRAPLFLKAGRNILIHAQPGSETVTVSKFAIGVDEQKEVVSTRIADVVHTAIRFGAGYPEIVEMMMQADKQRNLPGLLAIDALPQGGRSYVRPETDVADKSSKRQVRVGNSGQLPNLFSTTSEQAQQDQQESEPATTSLPAEIPLPVRKQDVPGTGTASLADVRSNDVDDTVEPVEEKQSESKKRFSLKRLFKRSSKSGSELDQEDVAEDE